ncbi:regulator of penicillin binding proteins and beta lactamase transcription (morphogene) [Legionella lansingensis]|uniref:Protein BolA n=1 Tax=Legionella lansingensis TaxID=45067 RepID=A0A0W0VTU9_9GAMM|nr:BolA family protein [Legionella lansingensis]KTD23595.1 Protein BolA [Legionella lansingensis]SNV52368.1 regulator of penicillin binding proteins and beta lactamase transcription (morphogene) [Legionella lansingensis]
MSRQDRIITLINGALDAAHLSVENESSKHHVPLGSETHFKVLVVSDAFKGMTMINRHRKINSLLDDELKTGLHALTLHLYTPEEWQQRNGTTQKSPSCRDGYHHG